MPKKKTTSAKSRLMSLQLLKIIKIVYYFKIVNMNTNNYKLMLKL